MYRRSAIALISAALLARRQRSWNRSWSAHPSRKRPRKPSGWQFINSDFAALGEAAVVPGSQIDTYGLFAVESFNVGRVTDEMGARAARQSGDPQGNKSRFYAPLTGPASALWCVDGKNRLSLPVMQSPKAPQVQEVFSKVCSNTKSRRSSGRS